MAGMDHIENTSMLFVRGEVNFSENVETPISLMNESYPYYTNNAVEDISAGQIIMLKVIRCLYVYVIPVVSTFGIIGNVWSFRVFVFTSFRRHPSSTYLAALSISDTGFLTTLILSWVGSIRPSINQSTAWCRILIYITYICSFLSVWYVVLIMVDRYVVVCFPFKAQRLCSKRRSRLAVIAVTIFAFILYLYSFAITELIQTRDGNICSWRKANLNVMEVFTYIDTGITFIVPVLSIFSLNVIVITSIRKSRYRQSMLCEYSHQTPHVLSSAQVRLTTMLVILSTVFLVLNLPSHGIRFYLLVHELMDKTTIGLLLAQQICQILYYTNFAINVILYSASSKMFRRVMCKRIACKSKKSVHSKQTDLIRMQVIR